MIKNLKNPPPKNFYIHKFGQVCASLDKLIGDVNLILIQLFTKIV